MRTQVLDLLSLVGVFNASPALSQVRSRQASGQSADFLDWHQVYEPDLLGVSEDPERVAHVFDTDADRLNRFFQYYPRAVVREPPFTAFTEGVGLALSAMRYVELLAQGTIVELQSVFGFYCPVFSVSARDGWVYQVPGYEDFLVCFRAKGGYLLWMMMHPEPANELALALYVQALLEQELQMCDDFSSVSFAAVALHKITVLPWLSGLHLEDRRLAQAVQHVALGTKVSTHDRPTDRSADLPFSHPFIVAVTHEHYPRSVLTVAYADTDSWVEGPVTNLFGPPFRPIS